MLLIFKKIHQYLQQEGKLLVWTKIYASPQGFEQYVPYLVGITQLKSGEKIISQIVDCQEGDLKINQKVTVIVRKLAKVKPD